MQMIFHKQSAGWSQARLHVRREKALEIGAVAQSMTGIGGRGTIENGSADPIRSIMNHILARLVVPNLRNQTIEILTFHLSLLSVVAEITLKLPTRAVDNHCD
jgi:hypothetical protein